MEKIQKFNLFNGERTKSISQKPKDSPRTFLLPYLDEKFFAAASAASQSHTQKFPRSPSVNLHQSVFLNDQFVNYLQQSREENVYRPLYKKEREPTPSISYSKTIESFNVGVPRNKLPIGVDKSEKNYKILQSTTRNLWKTLNELKTEASRSQTSMLSSKEKEIELERLKI